MSPPPGHHPLTFQAGAGDGIAAELTRVTYPSGVQVVVFDPSGARIAASGIVGPSGFMDTVRLPAPGVYRVRVVPFDPKEHGSSRIHLIRVPPDVTTEITPDGPPVTSTNTVPGQNMRLTFAGKQGERISMAISGIENGLFADLLAPDGDRLSAQLALPPTSFVDTLQLTSDGTWTVLLDPDGEDLGSATVAMREVPPDPVVETRPGSEPFTLTTTVPGQNADVTFAGRKGQRISMNVTDIPPDGSVFANLFDPDGTRQVSAFLPAPAGYVDTLTLPEDGTYRMVIDPVEDGTGSVTVALHNVPPDASAELKVDGGEARLATTVPGQNMRVRVAGGNGPVTLHLSGMNFGGGLFVQAFDDAGNPIVGQTFVAEPGGDVRIDSSAGAVLGVLLDLSDDNVGSVVVSASSSTG